MKERIKCYVYKNREFVGKFNSLREASLATGDNQQSIRFIMLGKQHITRKGYVYTAEPLTEEEIQNTPILEKKEKEYIPRHNNECKKILANLELEVPCYDHQVFYLERSKEGRKAQLRAFIYSKLHERWMLVPQKVSILEKHFVEQLLDSL